MAQTVRIDETTHALLKSLAEADGVTLNEELARAVRARRTQRFFEEMATGYSAMTPKERAEDDAEASAWDIAASEGLEDQ